MAHISLTYMFAGLIAVPDKCSTGLHCNGSTSSFLSIEIPLPIRGVSE